MIKNNDPLQQLDKDIEISFTKDSISLSCITTHKTLSFNFVSNLILDSILNKIKRKEVYYTINGKNIFEVIDINSEENKKHLYTKNYFNNLNYAYLAIYSKYII